MDETEHDMGWTEVLVYEHQHGTGLLHEQGEGLHPIQC